MGNFSLVFSLLSILLLSSSHSSITASADEAFSLIQFKQFSIEHDPKGFLQNWSTESNDPCSWTGILCSTPSGSVQGLNLSDMGLVGQLRIDTLMALPELQDINLHGNFFNGDLSYSTSTAPSSCSFVNVDLSSNNFSEKISSPFLTSCTRLLSLNLSSNSIPAGVFPFSSSIRVLDVSNNSISDDGLLNFSFSNCQGLTHLRLADNKLAGRLPSLPPSCAGLAVLDLSVNNFSGQIPAGLAGACKNLTELNLSSNLLTGGLPSDFSACSKLQILDLSRNNLSGNFVEQVVAKLPSLKRLLLSFNNISGELPLPALAGCKFLEEIDLSSNEFIGEMSAEFCESLPYLQKLHLADNHIKGSIPGNLGNCTTLQSIHLSFNELVGEIPLQVWSLPNLVNIVMWSNRLSGKIPSDLCAKNSNLEMLVLNFNALTGTIPESLSGCSKLIWVSLSGNQLVGMIPTGIGNLQDLAILQLGNNSLSGPIPGEIGKCKNLIWLDLNSNQLTGPIPASLANQTGLITAGIVSGKQFAFLRNENGNICPGVGTLFEFQGIRPDRLQSLGLPLNLSCKFTRIYQGTTVYTFQTNGSIIYMDLSYNNLTGDIPTEFGVMKYLIVLNLGHNLLTGPIPSSFGGLKMIGVLDLSHNNLTGPIPGSLGANSFLNDLDVSYNNLSGEIPRNGQLITFPPSRYENNPGLCGVPLQLCKHSPPPDSQNSNANHHRRPLNGSGFSLLIGVALSVLILLSLALALFKIKKRRKKAEDLLGVRVGIGIGFSNGGGGYIESVQTSGSGGSSKLSTSELAHLSINVAAFEKTLRKLTFAHLVEATSNFSAESLIGSGGFGDVYHARLKDGAVVAVKKLIHVTGQGDREFTAEMETIGKIKHRNLVPLLGYCKVGDERLLVYEYMRFGSLDVVLHDSKNRAADALKLDWSARKKIAIGSARGLAFLHHSCIPHIIHRDMKSSNVLLDENLEARVSDFGMARLMNALDTHLSVTTLAGTPGYVPPEYYQSFRCTTKGDVYSYGVVLLELLSGKKPIDTTDFGDTNLVGWAKQLMKENKSADILDPELVEGSTIGEIDELHKYLKITFECLEDRPFRRPTMIQVMAMFKQLQIDADGSSGSDVLDGLSIGRSVIEESA